MYMKVTVAEFRKNLKKYLDLLESGEIVEVRGVPIIKVFKLDGGIRPEAIGEHKAKPSKFKTMFKDKKLNK